ncbi:MAG: flagellar biosynthetic protein FliR [Bacillota bacterium]|nr:flagellar biosynthetic protein FliR [Bacillota bacterium]
MEIPLGIVFNGIDAFLLIFVRMTGLFVIAPIFGRRNIPAYLKVGFALLSSIILVNTISLPKLNYTNFYEYGFLVAKEFVVGIVLGYVAYLMFTAIFLAGQIIDTQVGFGMVNVMDPMSNIQVSISSNFYFIISMLMFLGLNGHLMLIRGLFDSYKLIPLGSAIFSDKLMNDIIAVFGSTFALGFKIAAPIITAILITDISLGVISRALPQMNVFVVGMPLKIFLGILIMLITIPMFISVLDLIINGMHSDLMNFIKDLAP